MIKFSYKKINLPFKYPFTISKGTKTHQPSLIVKLEYFGQTGYGEAPAITYYEITVEKMIEDLEAKKPFVEKFSLSDPERYWHYLHHLFPQVLRRLRKIYCMVLEKLWLLVFIYM